MASMRVVGGLLVRCSLTSLSRRCQASSLGAQPALSHLPSGHGVSVRELYISAALQDAFLIRMPSLSPTMQTGTIIKWHKKEGDAVAPGDVLCDIQTDKAVLGFEVDEEGTLARILKPDNSTDVSVGTLIALIAEPGEDWQKVTVPAESATGPSAASATGTAASAAAAQPAGKFNVHSYGPAVRSILDVYSIKPQEVSATGPHGRLLKGDLLKYIKDKGLKPAAKIVATPPAAVASTAAARPAPTAKPAPAAAARPGDGAAYTDIPLTSMRSVIAKRLTESKTKIPHTYATIDCRMDNLLRLRKELQSSGIKVGVNDFIVKASAMALQKVPGVNSVWSGDSAKIASSIDISVAVATDNGLITPIVKNAVNLSVEEIAAKVKDLAGRARAGKLKLDEFQGGSFTISNLGMFGISSFSAVINPPQTCILAIGGSRVVPASADESDDLTPLTLMSVTTSADARVIDDLMAAQFLSAFADIMDNPVTMMLHGSSGSQFSASSGSQQGGTTMGGVTLQKLFAK